MIKDNLNQNEDVKPNTVFEKKLKEVLPEFFTANKYDQEGNLVEQGRFDLEKFQLTLKEQNINELTSGYKLDFIGKDYAKKQSGESPTTVIVPDNEHNKLEENKKSKNLFFTGDNLEVLRHLQNNYENSVDVIYIDPPYNTGKDGFVYSDSFEYSDQNLKGMFGLNTQELNRMKSIQGKSTHSSWLTFMYPRITLAKKMLNNCGILFASIDDNEQANFKLMLDEIFGEKNFIGNLSVENNPKGRKNSDFISVSSEYVLVYAKNIDNAFFIENFPKRSSDMKKDEDGVYVHGSGKRILVGENKYNKKVSDVSSQKHYTVYYNLNKKDMIIKKEMDINEKNIELINKDYKRYISHSGNDFVENTYTEKKIIELFENNALDFKDNKIFEKNFNDKTRIKSIIRSLEYEAIINNAIQNYVLDVKSTSANRYLENLFNKKGVFSSPKSVDLIKLLITLQESTNLTVFDFFAGSSTTAEAVMQLNAIDGGTRKYIMAQLDEKIYVENDKGIKNPKKGSEAAFDEGYLTIDEISRERIKRASEMIKEEIGLALPENFDGGFKHYRIVSPDQLTLDDLDEFDIDSGMFIDSKGQSRVLTEAGFDDMINPFSSESLQIPGNATGEESILTTWMVFDGYKFDMDTIELNVAGYKAYYVDNARLYVINKGWRAEQTREIVNLIGTNKITIQTIVLYGYSFNMESIRELEIALKQLDNKVNLIKRY